MKEHQHRLGGRRPGLAIGTGAKAARRRPGRACFEQLESRSLLAGDTFSTRDSLNHGDAGVVTNALNATPPSASVTLSTTDLNGAPISTVEVGQDFKLQVMVQDLRTTTDKVGFGVYAEYVNVAYNSLLASIPGSLTFDPAFANGQSLLPSVLATPGQIVQAGAYRSGTTPVSLTSLPPAQLLWTVTVQALASGTETFNGSQPLTPAGAFDVYGDDNSIPASQIQFVNASIVIAPPVTVSINSASNPEGNSGTTPFVFTVSLSGAATTAVTVQFATGDGTATIADNDYIAQSGTLTFAPGTTVQTITISVVGNTAIELNETFNVTLSNASANATIGQGQGTGVGTIVNDDFDVLAINNVSRMEGNSGTTNYVFTVTLSTPISSAATVQYATVDGTATVANDNYVSQSGTLTFIAGVTSLTITVAVNADTSVEPNDTFTVVLSNPSSNATIGTGQGTGTIVNDEGLAIPYQNPLQKCDVNADGTVSPVDALIIINQLNSGGSGPLAPPSPSAQRFYIDVNGDNALSPLDALQVINFLNSSNTSAQRASFGAAGVATGQVPGTAAALPASQSLTGVSAGQADTSNVTAATGVSTDSANSRLALVDLVSSRWVPAAKYEHDLEYTLDDLLSLS